MALDAPARATLLRIARQAIEQSFYGENLTPQDQIPALQEKHATFVTLRCFGELRGCVGTLEPIRPLLKDVVHNAHAAAFHDPRFPPLESTELSGLRIGISVLSVITPLVVHTRAELLKSLQPGEDGLIVQEGFRRTTFLPAVWETLPDADTFVTELFRKAGFPASYWSPGLRFHRYRTESFDEAGG